MVEQTWWSIGLMVIASGIILFIAYQLTKA
jgi:hypothetical protein